MDRMDDGQFIVLNNDPAEVLEFVEHLWESLDDALKGKAEHDWAMGVVEDLHLMVEIVKSAIERSERQTVQMTIPIITNGPKS